MKCSKNGAICNSHHNGQEIFSNLFLMGEGIHHLVPFFISNKYQKKESKQDYFQNLPSRKQNRFKTCIFPGPTSRVFKEIFEVLILTKVAVVSMSFLVSVLLQELLQSYWRYQYPYYPPLPNCRGF